MRGITGPVTRLAVEALAVDWADDASTVVEVVHREFNADEESGGYAFRCDRGLLLHGFDGASTWSLDPGDDSTRLAEVEEFWRASRHRNRELVIHDVSAWHRAAITALVAGMSSVAQLSAEARHRVADIALADGILVMLRRYAPEATEAAALRALAGDDGLLAAPGENLSAHQCPVCGSPALGRSWQYLSVCDDCYAKATCSAGRIVSGYNTDVSGGFEAVHVDDHSVCEEVGRTGSVRVAGHECRMGEAKFGGVFVGVAPTREYRDDASDRLGAPVAPRVTCHAASFGDQPSRPQNPTETTMGRRHYVIHGPTADTTVVEAWADDYIRFERRPQWQESLRNEIRTRSRELAPPPGHVLHAVFSGAKPANADVENLALYNIGSFDVAGRNGIRFELGAGAPSGPGGREYRFHYRYSLAPRSDTFLTWTPTRTLARFDWTDLVSCTGDKRLAQVWLSLKRGHVAAFEPAAPGTPFGVRLEIRPPRGRRPVWGASVKGFLDGVISAFQCQTDTTDLPELTRRLAATLPADAEEIEEHLIDCRTAVLGSKPKVVSLYGAGVKWDPADHLCVAGEVVAAESAGNSWAVTGALVELSRRRDASGWQWCADGTQP